VEPVEEATEADVEAINSLRDEFIALDGNDKVKMTRRDHAKVTHPG